MRIEPVVDDDVDEVVALWRESGLTRPWNDPHADIDTARRGPSTVLVGRDDGEVLATAMVGFDGHRGWVYYVAVRATSRGHGLGTEIMAAAEEWLRVRGVRKVQLMVRRENLPAVAFYRGRGYAEQDVAVLGRWLGPAGAP
ncbi:MAG: GNAT family acetyltransferase [Kineosporiaceae bacterium]